MLKKVALMMFTVAFIAAGVGMASASDIIDGLTPHFGGPDWQGYPYVNPGGTGDSLLYGYYNVRGNLNLFNIVNTTATDGQKVRVVFRNAKNSKECLDFSVCLSKGDVWTAFLIDNGTTAAICPFDTDTLTAPTIPSACQSFKYEGAGGITGVKADDCREGYFEVIGLESIPSYDKNATNPVIKTEADCRDWKERGGDVPNVLMGNNTIFELSTLATYSANAIAIAYTADTPVTLTTGVEKSIPEAMASNSNIATTNCAYADYMFMKSNIISPYDLISAIGGETEVIITFPTRLACHNTANTSDMFEGDKDPVASGIQYCTTIGITVWDDKEHRLDVTDFSPSKGLCLPYEVNVIKLGGSNIWNSSVASVVSVGSFDLGWIDIDLYASTASHTIKESAANSNYTHTLNGLPAVAYTTQSFVGGAASYMMPAAYKTNAF